MAENEQLRRHKIRAELYDNVLTEDPNDFVARVVADKPLTSKEVCNYAAQRGGADISAKAMEHAVDLYLGEMTYLLCNGFTVNTGVFSVRPKIKGVFNKATEQFNPEKHRISFDFSQGLKLRRELENVNVEITGVNKVTFFVDEVTDIESESVNDLLTPNRNLRISGSRIKIDGENAENGVYFINQETNERVKVSSKIPVNKPSELMVIIPSLVTGAYKLEIATQFSGNYKTPLKEPRKAVFDNFLVVL
jgi:nucleoid DNA-binding protein